MLRASKRHGTCFHLYVLETTLFQNGRHVRRYEFEKFVKGIGGESRAICFSMF